jgi:hypothetical protein
VPVPFFLSSRSRHVWFVRRLQTNTPLAKRKYRPDLEIVIVFPINHRLIGFELTGAVHANLVSGEQRLAVERTCNDTASCVGSPELIVVFVGQPPVGAVEDLR